MKIHPAAELFPIMSDDELFALAADIKANGLLQPLTMLGDVLLDGRNRMRACALAGVAPTTKQFTGDSPVAFVVAANLRRRDLTASQKACIAVEIEPMFAEEARKRMAQAPGQPQGVKSAVAGLPQQTKATAPAWECRQNEADEWQQCYPDPDGFREGWTYRMRPAPAPELLTCPCCGFPHQCTDNYPTTKHLCNNCSTWWNESKRAPCPTCAEPCQHCGILRAELHNANARADVAEMDRKVAIANAEAAESQHLEAVKMERRAFDRQVEVEKRCADGVKMIRAHFSSDRVVATLEGRDHA